MSKNVMLEDIKEVLFSQEQIQAMITRMGAEISEDYEGKNLLLVGILKGSVMVMADLMKVINVPAEIDFMAVSSYGEDTKTSGRVRIVKDLDRDIADYDVLIVEDILDSGVTLAYLKSVLSARNPASIKICTIFDKPDGRKVKDISADYVGDTVPDEFIVGYGLDYAHKYRNLPFVGILKESVYKK